MLLRNLLIFFHQDKELEFHTDHSKELVIGSPLKGVLTRSKAMRMESYLAFLSSIEPKNFQQAEKEESWKIAMQEEVNQFEVNNVWSLVPPPKKHSIIGTKWVFKNKLNEDGESVKNKARLVAQVYYQEEGIDFDETFARLQDFESIWMMLDFAWHHDFVVHQMDVKSAFFNGYLKEKVYVKQPLGFEDLNYLNHVFKLHKVLYDMKQAPRGWYKTLSSFLIS